MARPKKASSPSSPGKTTAKKGKKTKDPNAPKRAMSAFFFWLQENRPRIKKEGGKDLSVSEIAKVAGEEWGKLTDKSKWEKQAAEDKKRYEEAMKAYKNKE